MSDPAGTLYTSDVPGSWAYRIHRTQAGQWRFGILDAERVEICGGGGFPTEEEAVEHCCSMLADFAEAASDPVFGDEANTETRSEYASGTERAIE